MYTNPLFVQCPHVTMRKRPMRWNCSKKLQNASSCSRIAIQLFLRIILCCTTCLFVNQTKIIRIIVAWGHWNFPNKAQDICKRCNKVANCFFLIRSSVDGYKIIKTAYSLRVGDFGFSPSPRDVYYQFYKNAPIVKTPICVYQLFLDISLCLFQPTKRCNFWMVS